MKSSFLASLGFLLICAVGQALAQDKKGFRLIGVLPREGGYCNFKSQVIGSQKEFDAFVKQVEAQLGWDSRSSFLKALADAKVDFTRQALVLVRHTEGSGDNRVIFAPPELKSEKLVCVVHRELPLAGTTDLAFYCFAVAVDKGKAKEVEVWVSTKGAAKAEKPQEVLSLTAK